MTGLSERWIHLLVEGSEYWIEWEETFVTRRHQSGLVVESELRKYPGWYTYIGKKKGLGAHFYDEERGKDIFLTTEQISKFKPLVK